jgi:uncharacterized cupin superfamily protein
MPEPNVLSPEWTASLDAPFHLRGMPLGAIAGAVELGATLYELDPGGAVSPYHLHHANEEMLIVLSGAPSVRTPAGVRVLSPGAVVAFVRGQAGAHRVFNASAEPARVLLISTQRVPDVAEHLDTGAVLAMTGPDSGWVYPAGVDVPVMYALVTAMEAAGERE